MPARPQNRAGPYQLGTVARHQDDSRTETPQFGGDEQAKPPRATGDQGDRAGNIDAPALAHETSDQGAGEQQSSRRNQGPIASWENPHCAVSVQS